MTERERANLDQPQDVADLDPEPLRYESGFRSRHRIEHYSVVVKRRAHQLRSAFIAQDHEHGAGQSATSGGVGTADKVASSLARSAG